MATAQALITKSMRLLGLIESGASPTTDELNDGLENLNSMLDSWAVNPGFNYCIQDESLTLTASRGVYSIGTTSMSISSITRSSTTATATTAHAHGLETGVKVTVSGATQSDYNITAQVTVTSPKTFTYTVANNPATPATGTPVFTAGDFTTARPTEIVSAFTRATGTDTPLSLMTEQYWANIATKSTTSATQERLMYRPSYPLGMIYIHPVPTGTPELHIKSMKTIEQFSSLSDDQILPPGFRHVIELMLAIEIAPEFGARVSEDALSALKTTISSVMANNKMFIDSKQPAPPAQG